MLLLILMAISTVHATGYYDFKTNDSTNTTTVDRDSSDNGANDSDTPSSKPGDRYYGGPGQGSKLSRVRCPLRQHEVFVRNGTHGFVAYDETQFANRATLLRGSVLEYDSQDQEQYFHPCWCTAYYKRPMEFCPSSLQLCVVHGEDGPVQCLSHSGSASLAQVVWPTGFFYLVIIVMTFLCTKKGLYTYQYTRRKFCRGRNGPTEEELLVRTANHIMQQDGRPSLLGEDFVRRERRRLEQQNAREGVANTTRSKRKKVKKPYSLKTKSFTASSCGFSMDDEMGSNYDSDHGEEPECAICLGSLEHGDKVVFIDVSDN